MMAPATSNTMTSALSIRLAMAIRRMRLNSLVVTVEVGALEEGDVSAIK